jgi:hypothetical protein
VPCRVQWPEAPSRGQDMIVHPVVVAVLHLLTDRGSYAHMQRLSRCRWEREREV